MVRCHRTPSTHNMEEISKSLHSHLVSMAYEGCSHEQEHQMEHLVALLDPDDEDDLTSYYGLFGQPRRSLDEIARGRSRSPEQMLVSIERSLRRLAVTPEWQMMKERLRL